MASFRFELNGRPSRNGRYVVYLRVTIGGKRKLIKTPIDMARPSDFNAKCKGENWIRGHVSNAKMFNGQLADILAKAKETYRDLDKTGEVSTAMLAKEMNTAKSSPSFMAFARERTQMIYESGSFRNWKKYNGLLNKLDDFRKKLGMRDITTADITVDLLTKFDNYLNKLDNQREEGKRLHPNTIEVQFKVVRTLVRRAIEVGLMDASKDPFLIFKYKGVKTVKEKLDNAELERIINLELTKGSLIWHCRNYFLFSYYCAGIRAADLIQLRWINISENGRLRYQMGKNHKERDLVLVEQATDILRHYQTENAKSLDYIFPLLSNETEYAKYVTQADKDTMTAELTKKMFGDVSAKNALINKYLKKIAKLAKIEKPLSMHISRHTFAHIAQETGVNSGAIKNILGHSSLATTERYMGSFDTSMTDETLKSIFTPKQQKPSAAAAPAEETTTKDVSKADQAIELMRGMTPEEIMAILMAVNK